jgi:hypothetical protein
MLSQLNGISVIMFSILKMKTGSALRKQAEPNHKIILGRDEGARLKKNENPCMDIGS